MSWEDFLTADWPAPPGIVAGTTLRTGGVSSGLFASLNLGDHVGDDPAAVARNRRVLDEHLRLPSEPVWLRQVHGTQVIEAAGSAGSTEADASWSGEPGTVCAVMTADCLPVLLTTDRGDRVAAAHAGWRGLSAGVLENTVHALGVDPQSLIAWLGPAISQAAFEVGDEVRRAFATADPQAGGHFERNARGRWQADLYALARQRLGLSGVTRVYGGGLCTYADEGRFFAYGRDGGGGRMATLIFRRYDTANA